MRLMTVAALAAVSLTTLVAVVPAGAQSPRAGTRTESITVVDENGRRHTRITVRPRSFLDPGTATKTLAGHERDYAEPAGTYPGEYLVDRNDWKSSWSRMPFPTCADNPGMCR
jgi:hypothetical protein